MTTYNYNNQKFFSRYHLEKVIKEQTSDKLESIYKQIKQRYAAIAVYCHRKLGPPPKPRLCYNTILQKGVF